MTLIRSFLLALLLLAAPAAAQRGDSDWLYRGSDIERDPEWRFGTLDNGLRYAVRRSALPPGQVAIRIRIDAGALHEEEGERGWAHYVEHMLFRGTETYPDRQARHIWQQLGASFGSDSNARTSSTETVYQLNLPRNDRESLDTSLTVLAEMMAAARFEPAAVEAERPVVLAEKGRRPELTQRILDLSRPLFYRGLRFEHRDTIGTDETLNAATAEGLKAFYRRWYRPERTTIVLAGDADPDVMEALVRERFSGWRGEGPAPSDPELGAPADVPQPVAALAYPGAPYSMTLAWIRPYSPAPHTVAREREALEEALASRIVNRRLEAHARGESAFVSAGVGISRSRGIVDMTQMQVVAREGAWRPALDQAYAILSDALRAPPSPEEIDREIRNLRTAASASVQAEPTTLSHVHAERLIGAIDNNAVVATAATTLANFERNAPDMTPERVQAAMQRLFSGSGPRLLMLSPQPLPGGAADAARALAAARAATPATRRAERSVSFEDLPAPGRPGREIGRERIEDLGIDIVRFANGSTLTFKRTDFERGTVHVRFRFGGGMSAISPEGRPLAWLSGLVAPSGLADLDLDAMERLMTGRRIGLSFGVEEDAFVLGGQTTADELGDQIRLMTAKLSHPRWDAPLFARFRASAIESYDLHLASAASRAGRETSGVLRPGDARWRPVEKAEIEAVTAADFQAFFEPLLAQGPVHAVIVGDVALEAAVAAMLAGPAALPQRAEAAVPPANVAVAAPAPDPRPRTFTHRGDRNQAYALIGWSTLGGRERTRERRALSLAANMFRARLFDRLREEEGATYSPSAVHLGSETFPAWGVLYAAAEIRPERAETFFRIAREIVADLAARPAQADEFARAQNPVLSGLERRFTTNGYWVEALENMHAEPRDVENVRTHIADYRALTAEDVRAAMAALVVDEGDWSMLVLPEGR